MEWAWVDRPAMAMGVSAEVFCSLRWWRITMLPDMLTRYLADWLLK